MQVATFGEIATHHLRRREYYPVFFGVFIARSFPPQSPLGSEGACHKAGEPP
ncbi:hypothetical protein HT585_04005 [Ensifer sp. HO-A22]|uniref:Uncharacterized protein n=1 Tax=Ensifer oleiphilus TaxID=2742698 RepID=A0A7Y6Q2S1_9HYPH|nr:hypothetical protein [Ensifer oleiphilus]NVD38007.1 hypothetical protein [Ensifer oleiphilus]